jgi:hypothetical protein
VPEAAVLTFEEAARLAVARDEEAAESLKASVETQLQLERAAAVCNSALLSAHEQVEKRILAELGYLAN